MRWTALLFIGSMGCSQWTSPGECASGAVNAQGHCGEPCPDGAGCPQGQVCVESQQCTDPQSNCSSLRLVCSDPN